MVVVDDRAMKNVHVVDNRSPWPINGGLHAVVSSRMVPERLIACDSDFGYRKPNEVTTGFFSAITHILYITCMGTIFECTTVLSFKVDAKQGSSSRIFIKEM